MTNSRRVPNLNLANGNMVIILLEKLDHVLSNNKGRKQLQHVINNIHCGISTDVDFYEFDLKYAITTSA